MMKNCKKQPDMPLSTSQIDKCKKCDLVSTNLWCCHYGFWILGQKVENKKINAAVQITADKYDRDYEHFKNRYEGMPGGNQPMLDIVPKSSYVQRRNLCMNCNDKQSCPMRGCSQPEKLMRKSAVCPLKKW